MYLSQIIMENRLYDLIILYIDKDKLFGWQTLILSNKLDSVSFTQKVVKQID